MTQIGVLEHLKLENVTLSHQLTETQHRSIKEKERIAVQLQSIEVRPPRSARMGDGMIRCSFWFLQYVSPLLITFN